MLLLFFRLSNPPKTTNFSCHSRLLKSTNFLNFLYRIFIITAVVCQVILRTHPRLTGRDVKDGTRRTLKNHKKRRRFGLFKSCKQDLSGITIDLKFTIIEKIKSYGL